MKTSFYFVLWILIYPILGLLNNNFINNNAFFIALLAVWGVSWLLNKIMPDTIIYERVSEYAPILEDVYTGNVDSFKKRLSRDATVETITAVYFIITTFVIAITMFKFGANDWVALIVFGFFAFGAISRSVALLGAKSELKSNPTSEQCLDIAEETYKLDYSAFYEAHDGVSYHDMIPPKPRYYKVFKIFSLIIAVIAVLLGLLYIASGIKLMLIHTSFDIGAIFGMYFLYGSLATYFGVMDCISCAKQK